MDLQTLWFILIAVLFTGFFFLEGFDYGVGILLPFLSKDNSGRRVIINTIGPVWDGNEVWLLTAGGAIFAAFPHWYATLFSGFYMALFLILIALIVRGVAFEFRSKVENKNWKRMWDWAICFGSAVPALLWGVAIGNLLHGVAINEKMTYVGTFGDLINPYSLAGGLTTFCLFTLHGALFLELKTDGTIRRRAADATRWLYPPLLVVMVGFVFLSSSQTTMFDQLNLGKVLAAGAAVIGLVAAGFLVFRSRYGYAFLATSVTIAGTVALAFTTLFPRVMPSTLGFDLTIYNASSSQYTLSVMTVIALTLVPIVLAYQAWTYWVFRKRLTTESHLEY